MNTEILGVSRESIKSHESFKEKQNFNFELIRAPDLVAVRLGHKREKYVWKEVHGYR